VRMFVKSSIFIQPGPRRLIGSFPLSQVGKCCFILQGHGARVEPSHFVNWKHVKVYCFMCVFSGIEFGSFRYPFLSGQERPESRQEHAKSSSERPKSGQEWPKSAPRAAQERTKSGPRVGQELLKSGPRVAQEQ